MRVGYDTQLFPVVDFITRRQIGVKPRSVVHSTGLWHEGVQAFILRVDKGGKVETLVQRRSVITDLSAEKLDQSLATQALVEDNGDLERTFKRGLLEEYGISEDEVRYVRIGAEGWLRVSKKYRGDPAVFNREFISLFLVQLTDESRIVTPATPKIQDVYWQDWSEFVRSVQAHPRDYTKTSRYYILNRPLLRSIRRAINNFIGKKEPPPFPFSRSGYYSYPEGPDVFINKYGDYGQASIEVMDVEDRASRVFFRRIRSFDVYDAQSQPAVSLRFTSRDGDNFIWRGTAIYPSARRASVQSQADMKKIAENVRREMEQMRTGAKDTSQKELIDDLALKLQSNLRRIHSRVDAGDVLLLSPENAPLPEKPEKLVILAAPGTYDPPHLSHADLMLEAFTHVSETHRETPAAYAGFLAPVGQFAPGPDGQTRWKPNGLSSPLRHELAKALTDLFSPLIQTSTLGLDHPHDFGTEAALKLIGVFRPSFPTIDFLVVAGSETFHRWHQNFADLLGRYRDSFGPNVNLGVITFEDPFYPVDRIISEQGYKNVTVIRGFRNLGVHSRLFRETGDSTLLTRAVREKYPLFAERIK